MPLVLLVRLVKNKWTDRLRNPMPNRSEQDPATLIAFIAPAAPTVPRQGLRPRDRRHAVPTRVMRFFNDPNPKAEEDALGVVEAVAAEEMGCGSDRSESWGC